MTKAGKLYDQGIAGASASILPEGDNPRYHEPGVNISFLKATRTSAVQRMMIFCDVPVAAVEMVNAYEVCAKTTSDTTSYFAPYQGARMCLLCYHTGILSAFISHMDLKAHALEQQNRTQKDLYMAILHNCKPLEEALISGQSICSRTVPYHGRNALRCDASFRGYMVHPCPRIRILT